MQTRAPDSNATARTWGSVCSSIATWPGSKDATPEQVQLAVTSTIPRVAPMFWSFRVMVGLAFLMLALFVLSFASTVKANCEAKPWLLRWALWMLPAPWIAAELGWFIAEYGRQPWTIYGVLPTHLSMSTLSVGSLYGSLAGFIGFYTLLLSGRGLPDGQVRAPWPRQSGNGPL